MRIAKPKLTYVGDAKVRALLEVYACPVPLHAVKARFMGNIASPVLSVSPIHTIYDCWPDGLPEFESVEGLSTDSLVLITTILAVLAVSSLVYAIWLKSRMRR